MSSVTTKNRVDDAITAQAALMQNWTQEQKDRIAKAFDMPPTLDFSTVLGSIDALSLAGFNEAEIETIRGYLGGSSEEFDAQPLAVKSVVFRAFDTAQDLMMQDQIAQMLGDHLDGNELDEEIHDGVLLTGLDGGNSLN